jgi:hypothetical protein
MFVGIGEGGFIGGLGDAEMNQFAQATAQAVADLAQRIGVGELTKEHRNELRPTGETLGGTLGGVFLGECGELGTGKVLE